MTDKAQTFIIAGIYSVVGLYLFVFGALVLSGVVDTYFEFVISFLFTTINFPLINLAAPAIIFISMGVISILGSYYFLEDVLKHYVKTKLRKNNEIPQENIPKEKKEDKSDESSNNTIGGVLLIIGIFQLIVVTNIFLGYTPISLLDNIRLNPFDLRFPAIFTILIGTILWIFSFYFFSEAFKDFKKLEKTQIANISKKFEKNEIKENSNVLYQPKSNSE